MKLARLRPWIAGLGMALLVIGYAATTTEIQQAVRYNDPDFQVVPFWGKYFGGSRWIPGNSELLGWAVAALGAGLVGFALAKRDTAGT